MRIISYIIILLLVILGITFAALNAEVVEVNYYIGSFKAPLSLTLVLTMGMGIVLGLIASLGAIFRQRRNIAQLKSRIKLAEKEVDNLRTIPLKE